MNLLYRMKKEITRLMTVLEIFKKKVPRTPLDFMLNKEIRYRIINQISTVELNIKILEDFLNQLEACDNDADIDKLLKEWPTYQVMEN